MEQKRNWSSCSFHIAELDCAEEAATLRRAIAGQPGIVDLHFDYLRSRMDVEFDPARTSSTSILQQISNTGMHGTISDQGQLPVKSHWGRTALMLASGLCIALGFAVHWMLDGRFTAAIGAIHIEPPVATIVAYSMAVVLGLIPVLPRAAASLRRFRADMHVLVCIAVVGAIVLHEWFEAAAVSFLFALALQLEQWSIGRARLAITSLMKLTPATARCRDENGQWQECPVIDVLPGRAILIRPGERVPVDGKVTDGHSLVNQAPITGESQPVEKGPGQDVFAGSINTDRSLEIIATRAANDSAIARILQMVEQAQRHRAPSERWVESFARYYTPAMMALSLLVAIIPPLAGQITWTESIYNALVLLVIACPCALVISTPVTIVAALTAAARAGVLIKGGRYLEACARLQAVAVDKTGTLTYGQPVVERIIAFNEMNEQELLAIAVALEANSMHPLAHAIRDAGSQRQIRPSSVSRYRILSGLGVEGAMNGDTFWLGGERLVEERAPQQAAEMRQRPEWADEGHSLIAVGKNQEVLGAIVVADRVRENAADAVRQLRAVGIRAVHMLTGDHRAAAARVAERAGVDEYVSDALPQDKLRAIEHLRQRFGEVAMIGDGINDSPAMAAATIGIAMGAIGSDTALEISDVALMSDDLSRVPWLIAHARRTARTVAQNIAIALGIKIVFVILAITGFASLWTAIAADMGASLLVIANGLKLLRGTK